MPVVVATITPKPGKIDELEAVFTSLIPQVHDEPGCELYALHRNDGVLVMVEKWADADALAAHSKAPALAELGQRVRDLVDGPPVVTILEAVPLAGAPRASSRSLAAPGGRRAPGYADPPHRAGPGCHVGVAE